METGPGSGGFRSGDWTSPPRMVFGKGFGRTVRDDDNQGIAKVILQYCPKGSNHRKI